MVADGVFGGSFPITGSHEPAGTVVQMRVEAAKLKFKLGDRIAALYMLGPCGASVLNTAARRGTLTRVSRQVNAGTARKDRKSTAASSREVSAFLRTARLPTTLLWTRGRLSPCRTRWLGTRCALSLMREGGHVQSILHRSGRTVDVRWGDLLLRDQEGRDAARCSAYYTSMSRLALKLSPDHRYNRAWCFGPPRGPDGQGDGGSASRRNRQQPNSPTPTKGLHCGRR